MASTRGQHRVERSPQCPNAFMIASAGDTLHYDRFTRPRQTAALAMDLSDRAYEPFQSCHTFLATLLSAI